MFLLTPLSYFFKNSIHFWVGLLILTTTTTTALAEQITQQEKFLKIVSTKQWYKYSAAEIKEKIKGYCSQNKNYKFQLDCNKDLNIENFTMIGEHQFEILTQITFKNDKNCKQIIETLKKSLGTPSESRQGQCNARWNIGKNQKHKNTQVVASIYAPPAGGTMEFNIGSEQGDD